ncbi:MAG: NADH-quinone oxidoreductase subunit N [Hydrogenobacter sp.]|uniref:NADH-quinone oxidoreductase subunit N n=1 Tax=Hydrogenobacter thermophilus TaxID=940 RepID=UPI0030FB3685
MNWNAVLPEILLSVGIILIFSFELFLSRRYYKFLTFLAGLVPLLAVFSLLFVSVPSKTFFDVFYVDTYTLIGKALLYVITSLSLFASYDYFLKKRADYGEMTYLILTSSLGLSMLISSVNLTLLFLSLELASVTMYILIGTFRREYLSKEASYKYLVIGSVGTAMLAFGSAFYYGAVGSLFLKPYQGDNTLFLLSMFLILSALALKVSSVPFHFWTPDAYEGAPTPITAYISTAPKIAVYFLLVKISTLYSHIKEWMLLVALLSVLSMFYASFVAYAQRSVKRLLAYSSIAHAGYFLLGLVTSDKILSSALLFYLSVYIFAALGSFIVLAVLEKRENFTHHFMDYKGLGRYDTLLAFFFSIFLFAMIGIPPMALFVGKLGIFMGLAKLGLLPLAILFLVASIVSTGYYLKVIVYMFMEKADKKWQSVQLSAGEAFVLSVCATLVLLLGIFPNMLYDLIAKGL